MSDMVPLRRVTRLAYGDALALEARNNGDVPVVGSGGVSGTHDKKNFGTPGIVIGRKGSHGSIHWVPSGGFAIDTAYYIDNRLTSVNLRWLYYALQAVNLRGPSQDVGVPGLSREAAYNVLIPSPPSPEEQRRITDFLDTETARIDKLRGLRRQQLSLVRDKLNALAVELTGRTAIRELGHPVMVAPLRRALKSTQTGSTPPNLRSASEGLTPGSHLPWYTPAAMDEWMTVSAADKTTHLEAGIPLFPAGSVLITGIGESLGKVAILDHAATGNQQLTALTVTSGVDARFIAWQLWCAEPEVREWGQYSRIRIINNDTLKSFPIYLPIETEQTSTANKLDSRLKKFKAFQAVTENFDQVVAKRRQALIIAAVTGQIDVTTASGRNVTEGVSV